jgi:pimeloyl-ACP methyl ester carboxylesterase
MKNNVFRMAKQMLMTIVVSSMCLYVVVCGVLYICQEQLLFFPEVLAPDFTYSFPVPFEELTWQVDGATINALHFKAAQPKGVILYLHGNAGSLRSWGNVAAEFTAHGYDVLMPDYRGYGKSTGTITSEQMLHGDVATAYAYLRRHYAEHQIVVYGRSIGTGLAVYLAKSNHPKMVILETPYYNLSELATAQFPFIPSFLLKYPLRTDAWISEVKCPIYLLHGTEDEFIPYTASLRLVPLIKTKHRLFTIEGGGHNNLGAFSDYHEHLVTILQE